MISNSGTSTLGLYDLKRQIDAFGGVDYFRPNLADGYLKVQGSALLRLLKHTNKLNRKRNGCSNICINTNPYLNCRWN